MFVKNGNCNSVADVVVRNTGIQPEEFLTTVREPFLNNLQEAVDFVKAYLTEHPGCCVTIVGDYDSDGINATAIMYWCFAKAGVTPILRLPRRFSEGYGLSEKIIDEISSGLLVTVDNGIAAASAVKKAKEKGLAVVVTDHHLPPVDENGNVILPEADVVLDPHIDDKSEFSDYCGAALALRFAQRMHGAMFAELLVLASIATVTDVMPLVGANRTLVRDGLYLINKRRVVPGLDMLLQKLQMDNHIAEGDYGFKLGPIFNAPGRLYDDGAERVVKLLCTKRGDFTAGCKAEALIETNEKRKEVVKKCMEVANKMVSDDRPIVIYHPSFEEGIVGIIAGQLAETYHCPAVVFTDSGKEGILKGSGRSIAEIHLKKALDKIQSEIVGYGGHAGAAGISIQKDNLENFTKAFKEAIGEIPDAPEDILYDLELDMDNMDTICEELSSFAPFGEGNPQVVFHTTCNIDPMNYRRIGDGTHFMVRCPNITLMGFGLADKYEQMGSPAAIECVGYLSESWFNDRKSYKFEVVDFAPIN